MNRRETALLLLALSAAPRFVGSQVRAKPSRVAWLILSTQESQAHIVAAARQRLRELGHVEGKNLVLDIRYALGDASRVPALAKEMVASRPDVIITGTSITAQAAQQASATIPIVVSGGDIVATGLVKNLARPESNMTGVSTLLGATSTKLLELALALRSRGTRVAVLGNPEMKTPFTVKFLKDLQDSAAKANVELLVMHAQTEIEIDRAFAQMAGERVGALVVMPDTFFLARRKQFAEEAARYRIPSVFWRREFVEVGGLMSYGSDLAEGARLAANYVDRILKGAKPADLPIQQPIKLELAVNLRTARSIGITIPPDILLRTNLTIQ